MEQAFKRRRADLVAGAILVALWAAFFWRFLTPVAVDQVSLPSGDFSGQFVAFGAYQAERLWQGEVPLWDPYNNGGLPFLADTQSAVFYPPRLLTIALAGQSGGWTYHVLELEMIFHVLAGSLLMYALVRRLTLGRSGSVAGGLVAALTWAYGGFMTGYPPPQLALLEAVIWGPLLILGVHEATAGERPRWRWFGLGTLALGLSILAGHPQTYWFLALLAVAFLGYRVYARRWRWMVWLGGAAIVGFGAALLAAVQLLPGFEYLLHATRLDYGFEAKRNGFPIYDLLQIFIPRVVSVWSPLYVGIAGLILIVTALWARARDAIFWGGALLAALGLSFGGNTALYGALYNVLPGLSLFRGQERAALIVALAASILAGLGVVHIVSAEGEAAARLRKRVGRGSGLLAIGLGVVTLAIFVQWLGPSRETFTPDLGAAAFSTLVAGLSWLAFGWLGAGPRAWARQAILIGLIAFDLFTVGTTSLQAEPVSPAQHLQRPAVLEVALADDTVPPQRVDGARGVLANHGTLWAIPDIRGISPLWLSGMHALIEEDLPAPRTWELLAVKYVFSDWAELPVPSTIVASGDDGFGPVNAHQLDDPRPFALLLDRTSLIGSDAEAYGWLADPGFDARHVISLQQTAGLDVPDVLEVQGTATVTDFQPEAITVEVDGQMAPVVLSLALADYPGWQATLDGEPLPIWRAYGALSAVILPAAADDSPRTIELVYRPWTFPAGAALSGLSWLALVGWGGWLLVWRRRTAAHTERREEG